jgi:hypothetical protein
MPAAASLEPISRVGVGIRMSDQQRLPMSLTPATDLLVQAATARRLASLIPHDPAAPRLEEFAQEIEAEVARLSGLISSRG